MITTPSDVTDLVQAFIDVLNDGYLLLMPSSLWLLQQFGQWYLLMAVIAILMRATHPGEVLVGFLLALLKFLFYQLLVVNWRALCDGFAGAMMALAALLSANAVTANDVLNAGRIMGLGWYITGPIMDHLQRLSSLWDIIGAPFDLVMFFLAAMAMIVAFFLIGAQIVLAMIEFKVITVLAEPLLAFGLFQPTQFIAEAVVKGAVAGAVRLGAMAVIIGIIIPLIDRLGLPPGRVPTYWISLNMAAGSVLIMLMSWKAPGYASSLLSGTVGQAVGDLLALIGSIGYGGVRGVRAVVARA